MRFSVRPGDGTSAATDPAGEHRPEDPGGKQRHCRPECSGWHKHGGSPEKEPVEDAGGGDDFAFVTGSIQLSGDEWAQKVGCGD